MKKLLYSIHFFSFFIQAQEVSEKNTSTFITELAHNAAYDWHTQTWNLPETAPLLERFKKGVKNIIFAKKFEPMILKQVSEKSGIKIALLKKNFFHAFKNGIQSGLQKAYKKNHFKKETIN
jgi:hypothetical protein